MVNLRRSIENAMMLMLVLMLILGLCLGLLRRRVKLSVVVTVRLLMVFFGFPLKLIFRLALRFAVWLLLGLYMLVSCFQKTSLR